MITYEQRLNENLHWALLQGSMHFENRSEVHHTLRRIVKRLDELDVPHAVAGDMAMFFHGFRRYTETVVLLVTLEGWERIRRTLEGPAISRQTSAEGTCVTPSLECSSGSWWLASIPTIVSRSRWCCPIR
jgi:hypothetical protein